MEGARLKTPSTSPCPLKTSPEEEMKELPDYLGFAGEKVSEAMQHESEERFDESIDAYRKAIAVLIEAAPRDRCLRRQESVKRRVEQYVRKTEQLMLARDQLREEEEYLKHSSGMMHQQRSKSPIPHLGYIGDKKDLAKFKVDSVISNKVLVVRENEEGKTSPSNGKDEKLSILKPIQKSGLVHRKNKNSVLPVNVPFMVDLECYYETEDNLFLKLEYAKYGRLYDIVQDIFYPGDVDGEDLIEFPMDPSIKSKDEKAKKCNPVKVRVFKEDEAVEEAKHEDEFNVLQVIEDGDKKVLYCMDSTGIEKIGTSTNLSSKKFSSSSSSNSSLTEGGLTDSDDLSSDGGSIDEGVEAMEETLHFGKSSASTSSSSSSKTDIMISNAQSLLSSIDSKLIKDDVKRKAATRRLVAEFENVETKLRERLLLSSANPCLEQRCGSSSRLTPISSPFRRLNKTTKKLQKQRQKRSRGLSTSTLRRYAAQLFKALFELHRRGIIVRDLNPANLLVDEKMRLKLTYQCEWITVDKAPDSTAVGCYYAAPETELTDTALDDPPAVSPACDFWSAGVLLYELATGRFFVEMFPSGLNSHTPVDFSTYDGDSSPSLIDAEAADLITGLLNPNWQDRFCQIDVVNHEFFIDVDWSDVQ